MIDALTVGEEIPPLVAHSDLNSDTDDPFRAVIQEAQPMRKFSIASVSDTMLWSSSRWNASCNLKSTAADGTVLVDLMAVKNPALSSDNFSLDFVLWNVIKANGLDVFYQPASGNSEGNNTSAYCNNFSLVVKDEVSVLTFIAMFLLHLSSRVY